MSMESPSKKSAQSFSETLVTSHNPHDSLCELYSTTLILVVFLHILFFFQWRSQTTRKNVETSYRNIVVKKQFHRLVVALVSHPRHDESGPVQHPTNVDDPSGHESDQGDGGYGRSSSLPPNRRRRRSMLHRMYRISVTHLLTSTIRRTRRVWNDVVHFFHSHIQPHSSSSSSSSSTIARTFYTVATNIYVCVLHPLLHGHLAGLPLLTFISHILWQCRALEEIYDFTHDEYNTNYYSNTATNTTSNNTVVGSIIIHNGVVDWPAMTKAEQTIMKLALPTTDHSTSVLWQRDRHHPPPSSLSSSLSHTSTYGEIPDQEYTYHRVLLALLITSVAMDLCFTHWVLRSLRHRRYRRHGRGNDSNDRALVDRERRALLDRGICTLTPLCASVLVLFAFHFPYVAVSTFPLLGDVGAVGAVGGGIAGVEEDDYYFGWRGWMGNTLFDMHSGNSYNYLWNYTVLTVLSYRAYPILGVVYGTFSGILWTMGLTTFLAMEFWSTSCVIAIVIGCALSYKAELMASPTGGSAQIHSHRSTVQSIDWFPWLDYVSWDKEGNILQSSTNEQSDQRNLNDVSNSLFVSNREDEERLATIPSHYDQDQIQDSVNDIDSYSDIDFEQQLPDTSTTIASYL